MKKESAVFGGGCFWCTEAIFQRLRGVVAVLPGYAGGELKDPSYDEVCTGNTGHAEVIKIEYDADEISFEVLLDVFMNTHDPTSLNRQGNDVGTQYRSIILYENEGQKELSEHYLKDHAGDFPKTVVTEIQPLGEFYKAESYHENYFNKNGYQPYCSVIIAPKVKKFLEKYGKLTEPLHKG